MQGHAIIYIQNWLSLVIPPTTGTAEILKRIIEELQQAADGIIDSQDMFHVAKLTVYNITQGMIQTIVELDYILHLG